jgi:hypothetical protein
MLAPTADIAPPGDRPAQIILPRGRPARNILPGFGLSLGILLFGLGLILLLPTAAMLGDALTLGPQGIRHLLATARVLGAFKVSLTALMPFHRLGASGLREGERARLRILHGTAFAAEGMAERPAALRFEARGVPVPA